MDPPPGVILVTREVRLIEVAGQTFTGADELTVGAAGAVFGAAVPLPEGLVQPLTVLVTVYIPGTATVIPVLVAPVLHKSVPVETVERLEVPLQLSTTVTTGAVGTGLTVTITGFVSKQAVVVLVPLI